MKYPTMRFVFDRKKVASKTRKGLVNIEVTYNRNRRWLHTGVKVYADQWDDRKKVIRHIDCIQLNTMLDAQMSNLNEFIAGLIKSNKPFDFDKMDEFLQNKEAKSSFIDFVRNRIEERSELEESTRKQHRTMISSVEEFGKIKHVDDLTRQNITLYYEWLHGKGITQTTVFNYIKRLKVYIHEAMKFGLLESDPTVGIKFERGKSEKRKYLTEDELSKVKNCKINSDPIKRVRDLFLFQCYTGLAYSDLSKFNFEKDVENRNGKYVVADRRKKTNEDYCIVLLSPAIKILKKYDFSLPIISNVKYNAMLKVMAQYAGIEKNITTHMARHTFAVFALNNGVPMEVVAKMLGHTNIKTTQLYAKVLNREVEKGFDILERKLK